MSSARLARTAERIRDFSARAGTIEEARFLAMNSRVLLLVVGLAAAALVAAVMLLTQGRTVAETSPESIPIDASDPSGVEPLAEAIPSVPEARQAPQADEARKEVGAPTMDEASIQGRVVEADGGPGLPGIEVQLHSRRESIAHAVSDDQGRFELPYSMAERLAVVVVEPEGWKAARRRQRISSEEPPVEEIVFELRRSSRAVLRGRAIDASSGEPLPSLRLAVGPGFGAEELETDAAGRFTTRHSFEVGDVPVVLLTASGSRWMNSERVVAHDGSSTVHDVAMAVGATYDVHVAAPPGHTLADLRAFLAEPTQTCPWTLTDDPAQGERLHAVSPSWVRFTTEPISYAPEGELATLWITTPDGRWLGSCNVAPISQRGSAAHQVTLVPCGSVEVLVRGPPDQRDSELVAQLRWPGRDPCRGLRRGAEADGRHRFRMVPSGEYVLMVESNRTRPMERTIRVSAGEPIAVEIELESLPRGGAISGFVRTQSGRYKAADQVELSRSGQPWEAFHTAVHWTQEGDALVGRFAFEDVPAGEYELSTWHSSHFEWRTSVERITPPAAGIELLCLDGAGGMTLEVEAFDARTGKPVRGLAISIGSRSIGAPGSHRFELGRFPRDAALEWEATSDGYLALAGDLSSFEPIGQKKGEPLLRARIELQPGWGGRVLAYTEDLRIAGAVVLCDDVEMGVTNERGELDVILPARPQSFEVRHPGFVMEHPAAGDVPDSAAMLNVYMKPRE